MVDREPEGARMPSGRRWLAPSLAFLAALVLAALAVVTNLATTAVPVSWSWARDGWILWPAAGILAVVSAGLASRLAHPDDPETQAASRLGARYAGPTPAPGLIIVMPSAPVMIPAPEPMPVATSGQRVVGELPGTPPSFQERPELAEIASVFDAGERVAVVCALAGARGVGKTQLAAAYARQQACAVPKLDAGPAGRCFSG
jgi:hypothetical protein